MTELNAPLLPTEEAWDDALSDRAGSLALIGLSALLWLCALGALHAAWESRLTPTPATLAAHHATPLYVASTLPRIDVGPILPGMAEVMPSAGNFMMEAGTLLAKDEAESAVLKLSLLGKAGSLLAARLR